MSPTPRSSFPWWWVILILLVGGGTAYYFLRPPAPAADSKSASNITKRPAPLVSTLSVRRGDIPVRLSALGSVIPLNTVTVKSRVDGQIMKIYFSEGQLVQANDPLVDIDPRPYQVALEQALAQQARDQATLSIAQQDLNRYQTLWSQDSVAKQTLDTQAGTVKQDEATVQSDQAAVDNAKLNLTYCSIAAPIAGRIGLRLVDVGNMVHASDTTGIVVITEVQPIDVLFTLPEDDLPPVLTKLGAGDALQVEAWDRNQKKQLALGALASADNQIDRTTGTLKFKALFKNEDNGLFPNQFVNVRLLVDTKKDVVLCPLNALQRGAQNSFVYVVKPDNTVSIQNVEVGTTNAKDVEITKGLSGTERVVVDGLDKLQDGSKVTPKDQNASKDSKPSHQKSGSDADSPAT